MNFDLKPKMISVLAWILIAIKISSISSEYIYASVTWNCTDKQYQIHNSNIEDAVAVAAFQNEIFTTGWAYLKIKTTSQYPDQVQAYAAGLVEGYLTQDLIAKAWKNSAQDYCLNETQYCSRLKHFLDTNLDYMNREINSKRTHVLYFHQVALILEQLSGLEDGFHNVTKQPRTDKIDTMGLMMMNIMGDNMDLEKVLNRTQFSVPRGIGACSALVKVLDNNKDIYFGHNTWINYNMMLRILKDYDFEYHEGTSEEWPIVSGRRMTFSSRPGTLGSMDDFNLMSSGLATVETTIDNRNESLWKLVQPENSILEWIRSIIANRLAVNGSDWTNIFSYLNSGTYNNQWMILDYTKFQSGKPLPDNLLWISEQMPGYIHNEDMTDVLRNQSYWPSYNVPYFQDIFDISENQKMVDKYGDYFSYERTSRARIFKRDHNKVHDLPSMVKLMRYNDFKNDPLSSCNCTPPYSAINAIAARCDLNPKNGSYPFEMLGHLALGATDLKVTSSSLFHNLQFVAISGPTYDPLPPFQWSKSDFAESVPHEGHPDLWQFEPILGPFP